MSLSEQHRNRVLVGNLPDDFLRLPGQAEQQQIDADYQAAQLLQMQGGRFIQSATVPRISLTVLEARLNKNYGLTRMDPYCRVRVGHSVFETNTSPNGSKTPVWNKKFLCFLPPGVDSVYVEIFDERAFTMDERIAWAHILLPGEIFEGETVERWFDLSGKLGENLEGQIKITASYHPYTAPPPSAYPVVSTQPIIYGAGTYPPVIVSPIAGYPVPGCPVPVNGQDYQPQGAVLPVRAPTTPHQGPSFTEEDVRQVKELFPDTDAEVIRSVMESNRGNKEATINNLLSMADS